MLPDLPSVSALCITGKSAFHLEHFLPIAVKCLENQEYPADRLELVAVTERDLPRNPLSRKISSTVIRVPALPKMNLGALRNTAISAAQNDLILQWDDDDYHHPQRIIQQVRHWIEHQRAVCLCRQLCYSFETNVAFVREFPYTPIQGSILAPRISPIRYPDWDCEEDTDYLVKWIEGDGVAVLDNDACLYVRFSHGRNTWSHGHIMRECKDEHDEWHLTPQQKNYLRMILQDYPGLQAADNYPRHEQCQ